MEFNEMDNFLPYPDEELLPSSCGPPTPPNSVCGHSVEMSQMELEAFAAVQEVAVASFVKSIHISEVLVRTPDLLFLNLITLEGESHCIELTQKGWRICSDKLDCMYGDFRRTSHHITYYETIYALLDKISPAFRDKFAADLTDNITKKLADRVISD